MPRVKGKCSACGMPLEADVAEPLAGAELAASLCPACCGVAVTVWLALSALMRSALGKLAGVELRSIRMVP